MRGRLPDADAHAFLFPKEKPVTFTNVTPQELIGLKTILLIHHI